MILVEGLDNTGKTTLVEHLADKFDLKLHPSIGNKHDLNQIVEQAYYQAEEAAYNEIWDRSRFISEYVYNPILQGRALAYPPNTWLKLLGEWITQPQCVVYCRRPLHRIRDSFDEREQLGGVAENLVRLFEAYDHIMWMVSTMLLERRNGSVFVTYDFEVERPEKVEMAVKGYLALWEPEHRKEMA